MTTPRRGLLFHLTHLRNLPSVIERGLRSDSAVRADGTLEVEIGQNWIKEQRRQRVVPIGPGGVVADYAPFYFAPRSPMLFTIRGGNVPAYQDGQDPLVYLVSDVPHLQAVGCRFVFTDRNAYYKFAAYEDDPARLNDLVDWPLMEAFMWKNTDEDPDRQERRMAELLVHDTVPFRAFTHIGVRSATTESAVAELLAKLDHPPKVIVRPDWYF